ncbi:dsDNA nuclease domain-containing protein [Paraclostridium sordellii]|uniref:dsDNA nuclease domain-containing protein n=1 Tax=Paraclostridium sordellii TaxID=1505 RepID=UPI0018985C93|nr:dsDNA nuclease domain-containing protein [Paeniclostridium sordellii]
MDNAEAYMRLPHDLSGARSKGRFDYELLWGLKKMISLFIEDKKFIAVFDQACDVEFHFDGKYEFYQVKTDIKSGAYTIDKLTKKEKKKKNSILGNLCLLKYVDSIENKNTKLYIVSNTPLKDNSNKLYSDCYMISLNSICEDSVDTIKARMKSELDLTEINLKDIYFIREHMNLIDPEAEIRGELTKLFEDKLKCDYRDIGVLYKILKSDILKKGKYELKSSNYESVIKNKGFSYEQLEYIINQYKKTDSGYIGSAKEYINNSYSSTIGERIKYNKAWRSVLSMLVKSKDLQLLEKDIYGYLKSNLVVIGELSDKELIEIIREEFYKKKLIEMDDTEFLVFLIIIIKKSEEQIFKELEVSEYE